MARDDLGERSRKTGILRTHGKVRIVFTASAHRMGIVVSVGDHGLFTDDSLRFEHI